MGDLPQLDGYRVIAKIGEGGMARVYQGVQLSLNRPVALKLLAPELAKDENFAKRFLREAHIIGSLSHRSIVPVYEVGEQNGQYFLAMEWLTGGDLNDAMRAGLTEPRLHSILQQVAGALAYAHRKNIVHRDIKPDNVLMRDPETAMVADFGIAREIVTHSENSKLTALHTVIGSPRYMSPEQMRGEPIDQRTDIYALGVLAWQLLTGELPHSGRSLAELSVARVQEPIPRLPARLQHWQPLCDRLLAYDKNERFDDCDQLLQQLAELKTDNDTIVVNRLTPGKQAQATRSRASGGVRTGWRPLITGVTAVAIALLALGVWLWRSETTPDSVTKSSAVSELSDVRLDSFERSSDPLMPSAQEYFSFRDILMRSDAAASERFAQRFPDSILGSVLRVHLLGDQRLLDRLQERAASSEPLALLVLSELYANGFGVAKDDQRAIELSRIAAEDGGAFASYQLASLLISQSPPSGIIDATVANLLAQASESGVFLAQTMLGNLEFAGRVVGQPRPQRSLALFEQASAQGDRNALFNLGQILAEGLGGVEADPARARECFVRAADLGHPQALSRAMAL